MVSLFPLFMSHSITISGEPYSWLSFTKRVPNRMRRFRHTPSTEVPGSTRLLSSNIVIRAQCSLSSAWFGQQSILAGNFGGATRRDGSRARQSPRGWHGGDRQESCSAGTHTSWPSHAGVELALKQFGRPHQIFEHFGIPLRQTHELQLGSSLDDVIFVLLSKSVSPSAVYGDNVEVFKHTEAGFERTANISEDTFLIYSNIYDI